jgi:hypothetical protein
MNQTLNLPVQSLLSRLDAMLDQGEIPQGEEAAEIYEVLTGYDVPKHHPSGVVENRDVSFWKGVLSRASHLIAPSSEPPTLREELIAKAEHYDAVAEKSDGVVREKLLNLALDAWNEVFQNGGPLTREEGSRLLFKDLASEDHAVPACSYSLGPHGKSITIRVRGQVMALSLGEAKALKNKLNQWVH